MTRDRRRNPDPTTHTAIDLLRSWLPADQLLARLEQQLRADGATFDDIDQALTAELGVTLTDWHGYHTVRHAADHYQHTHHTKTPDQGAHID